MVEIALGQSDAKGNGFYTPLTHGAQIFLLFNKEECFSKEGGQIRVHAREEEEGWACIDADV